MKPSDMPMSSPWLEGLDMTLRHKGTRVGVMSVRRPEFQRVEKRKDGMAGTKPEAVILDMDGTLENWNRSPNPPGMEYVRRHHAEGRVIIVLTARDHHFSYRYTHDWLKENLDVPFVGPICRPDDDERWACDFKRDTYQHLSMIYNIVGAIDDDEHVLEMWESIPDLEVVATNYTY